MFVPIGMVPTALVPALTDGSNVCRPSRAKEPSRSDVCVWLFRAGSPAVTSLVRKGEESRRWERIPSFHPASLLPASLPAHAVFDVVVDDEVQFLFRETVVLGEDGVDRGKDGLG